jgi:hypothetical protein
MSSLCFASICKHIYARGAFGPFHRPARASICWMPFAALRKQSCIQLARPSWTRLRAATVAAVAFGGFVWGRKSGHDKDAYFGKLLDEITTQGAWTALCEAEPRDVRHHFRYFIADAVEKAAASVVKISCVKDDQWYSFQTSGSGFIFEPSAILTSESNVVCFIDMCDTIRSPFCLTTCPSHTSMRSRFGDLLPVSPHVHRRPCRRGGAKSKHHASRRHAARRAGREPRQSRRRGHCPH